MQNRYNSSQAQALISAVPEQPAALALRVYTSRLIGAEPGLVLHGGGNTSAKARVTTLLGEEMEVLFIKGSGWDLATIEPAGFPALDLGYLRKLRRLEALTDEEMVNQFRTHLRSAAAPDPSIETLVHAFLPHAFIDHTHADAIVTLTNLVDGEALLREALGPEIGILPFIMPGFPLAKEVARLYESRVSMDCIILMHHGIFTFADDAESAYAKMIDYVTRAENFIAEAVGKKPRPAARSAAKPDPAVLLPMLRGALALPDPTGQPRTMLLAVRHDADILAALDREDAEPLFTTGVLTPDHVIRTKNYPLFLDLQGTQGHEDIQARIGLRLTAYRERYDRYVTAQATAQRVTPTRLDPMPRVILVPGLGLVTAGATAKDAGIAADIASHTLRAKIQGAALGPYRELDEASIFAMEYWRLEQAKLGRTRPQSLSGKVALVTGGGGAMALGIGRQLLAAGARLFLSEIDPVRLGRVTGRLAGEFGPGRVDGLVMDVTDLDSVTGGLNRLVLTCGGLDILVPNAGVAHVARLEDLDAAAFVRVMAVNCTGTFTMIKAAVPIFRRQGTGGHIIINSSKNVFAPSPAFGAYSASKAAAHQLGKIAALELAEIGVRVNMINADAVFGDEAVDSGLWAVVGPDRMRARHLDPAGLKDYYRQRNLLKTEVLADHVGHAVVFFASNQTPTTGATLPVDGGIPEAFPR